MWRWRRWMRRQLSDQGAIDHGKGGKPEEMQERRESGVPGGPEPRRAAYAAVCDCYRSQSDTSFFLPPCFLRQVLRQPAAANVLAILGKYACFCSGGAFSHSSPPPCASIGLELAFTQPRLTSENISKHRRDSSRIKADSFRAVRAMWLSPSS